MDSFFLSMRLLYGANVVVAGVVGSLSLLVPDIAARAVFQNRIEPSVDTRILGALWLAIAIVSLAGLFRPLAFSTVLLIQLLYKGGWLLIVAAPALVTNRLETLPTAMAVFFLVWALVLPFVIPWRHLLGT